MALFLLCLAVISAAILPLPGRLAVMHGHRFYVTGLRKRWKGWRAGYPSGPGRGRAPLVRGLFVTGKEITFDAGSATPYGINRHD